MTRPTSLTPEVSASRRKLVRAGFAVPALATVASGSALAATSATCFARQMSRPGVGTYAPVSSSASADTFLRVQLGKFTKNGTGEVNYYVDGNNLASTLGAAITRHVSYTVSPGKFQKFDIVNNVEFPDVLNGAPNGGTYVANGNKFAVLRFNASGQVVGVGKSTSTGFSAVQASCWSSLAP
jgi:hypothetical protein